MQKFGVVLCPVLKAEGFISMDLYAEDVRQALSKQIAPNLEVYTLGLEEKATLSPWKRRWVRYVIYPIRLRKFLKQHREIPLVVHVLDHSYGHLCSHSYPTIVTCHDLANWRLPEKMSRLQFYLWKKKAKQMRQAKAIVSISKNTSQDVTELLDVEKSKIVLNYYGFWRDWGKGVKANNLESLRGKLKGKFVVLHIGTNAGRKNLETLLLACSDLLKQRREFILLKVGDKLTEHKVHQKQLEDLNLQDNLIETGIMDSALIPQVYSLASVMAFPSTYEGFGRPILEAQASELPIVCADSSCLSEIAGKGAIYHDPLDSVQLATQLTCLMDNEELRTEIIQKGLENIKRFSWEENAQKLLEVYEKIAFSSKN